MNKPRLIDANALFKAITDGKYTTGNIFKDMELQEFIKEQPTAYDIDKVVEQLENLETYKQTVTMEKHPFCASEIETVSKKKAIEIVEDNYSENPNSSKGGAVDDETMA